MASAAAGAWGGGDVVRRTRAAHTQTQRRTHTADADFVNICWWLGRPGGGLYHSVVMVAAEAGSV